MIGLDYAVASRATIATPAIFICFLGRQEFVISYYMHFQTCIIGVIFSSKKVKIMKEFQSQEGW